MRKAVIALFALSLFSCDDHSEEESYASFQECFDDHTAGEGLPTEEAIVVCALEHADDLDVPAFQSEAECEAYVDAELDVDSASLEEIMGACVAYFEV